MRPSSNFLLTALFTAYSGLSTAGNVESYFLGDEAALTAGAVTAVTGDASSAYYNPAGLGRIHRWGVDLTASAFSYRHHKISNMAKITENNTTAQGDISKSEFVVVPTSLVVVKRFSPRLTGALGVFVPEMGSADIAVDAQMEQVRSATLISRKSLQRCFYNGIASVGWEITPGLHLGASLVGVYYSYRSYAQESFEALWGAQPDLLHAFYTSSKIVDEKRAGAQALLGLQWQPFHHIELGLAVRAPILQLYRNIVEQSQMGGSGLFLNQDGVQIEIDELIVRDDQDQGFGFDIALPPRIQLGLAYSFQRGWVGIDVHYRFGNENQEIGMLLDDVWNVRLGGRYWLNNRISLGAGLFSDRSPTASNSQDDRIDYYGGTAGFEYRSTHAIKNDAEHDTISFSTALAFRYALGRGSAAGSQVNISDLPNVDVTHSRLDARVHEFCIHICTGVYF